MSPLLRAYLAFSQISGPIWRLSHRKRLKKGKESAERLPEKYGVYSVPRPHGTVLWFHALSVGESLALVPLIEQALDELPDAHVVLTTSTATSAIALGNANLPSRAIHILLPIDTSHATRAFLDHWQPDLAAFAELDFWPRLMIETDRRNIPMVLINSRMPRHNFERRRKLGGMMRDIVGLFDKLMVQDGESAKRFAKLGADPDRISVTGTLKAAARPLPADEKELAQYKVLLRDRPVWLAAATFGTEHAAMVEAHRQVSMKRPTALMILAPRHIKDADEAEILARARFANVARRSKGDRITSQTQIYIADTIGEMGLWYRLAPVSFIGHSLTADLEGKNPFEAAALGSAILHGAHVDYFKESYDALSAAGGARVVTPETLAPALLSLFEDTQRVPLLDGAAKVIRDRTDILNSTWDAIRQSLA